MIAQLVEGRAVERIAFAFAVYDEGRDAIACALDLYVCQLGSAFAVERAQNMGDRTFYRTHRLVTLCRRLVAQRFTRSGFDRSVALPFDAFFDSEFKARVVRIVVTRAANLQDRARVAFVCQAHDRSKLLCTRRNVIAARAMTRFATHRSEVSVGGVFALTVLGEAAPSPHAGGVTFEASRVVLLALGSLGFQRSVVRAFRPSFELARVAALARGRAHVVCVLGQHVSRLGVVTEQRGALLI